MSQFSQPLQPTNTPFIGINVSGVDPSQAINTIAGVKQGELNRAHEAGENAKNRSAQGREGAANRAAGAKEATADRGFRAGEGEKDRAAATQLAGQGQAFQQQQADKQIAANQETQTINMKVQLAISQYQAEQTALDAEIELAVAQGRVEDAAQKQEEIQEFERKIADLNGKVATFGALSAGYTTDFSPTNQSAFIAHLTGAARATLQTRANAVNTSAENLKKWLIESNVLGGKSGDHIVDPKDPTIVWVREPGTKEGGTQVIVEDGRLMLIKPDGSRRPTGSSSYQGQMRYLGYRAEKITGGSTASGRQLPVDGGYGTLIQSHFMNSGIQIKDSEASAIVAVMNAVRMAPPDGKKLAAAALGDVVNGIVASNKDLVKSEVSAKVVRQTLGQLFELTDRLTSGDSQVKAQALTDINLTALQNGQPLTTLSPMGEGSGITGAQSKGEGMLYTKEAARKEMSELTRFLGTLPDNEGKGRLFPGYGTLGNLSDLVHGAPEMEVLVKVLQDVLRTPDLAGALADFTDPQGNPLNPGGNVIAQRLLLTMKPEQVEWLKDAMSKIVNQRLAEHNVTRKEMGEGEETDPELLQKAVEGLIGERDTVSKKHELKSAASEAAKRRKGLDEKRKARKGSDDEIGRLLEKGRYK